MRAKKLTMMAMLSAVALILFTVEAQIPVPIPVAGIKIGLSNIVTVFAVFALGSWEGVAILAVRIVLGAIFSGNFSTIFYSAAGGTLAILVTIVLQKVLNHKQIWVAGSLGAIAHSIGQMAMAVIISGTPGLVIYLPVMLCVSIVTGFFTGLCAQFLLNRRKDLWKTISK